MEAIRTAGIRGILLDIEGTTTPLTFVTDVLFPYARAHAKEFLDRRRGEPDVQADLALLRREHEGDERAGATPPPWRDDVESAVAYIHALMDQDRKSTALKALQGRIWEEGFRSGALHGDVYPDVLPALDRWRRRGLVLAIFSSGSVLAQKLLFGTTPGGDLNRHLAAYFDTTTGPKKDPESYRRIAESLGLEPVAVLFVSDVVEELDAARAAGMATALCVRGAHPSPPPTHPVVTTFDGVPVTLLVLPCDDGVEQAERCRRDLQLPHEEAARLGLSAVHATSEGSYRTVDGRTADLRALIEAARARRQSLPPDAALPPAGRRSARETRVQVTNETTMRAGRRLTDAGGRPLALNFANGVNPGGGFLHGALAQEEVLCRSSALFATLDDDPMYEAHRRQGDQASSDWTILSPDVPFFRTDDGTALDAPWPFSVLTCAAPVATSVGQPRAGDLLCGRIHRVLAVSEAHGYDSLVLGAWGCGAFGNDPARTARDFRDALEGPYRDAFRDVVFAIADWSPERRFLGPFRNVFAARDG